MDIELNPLLKIGQIGHVRWLKNAGNQYRNNYIMTSKSW
jgi:hypothetical protein